MQSWEQGPSPDHGGFAGPLDSRATSLTEKPFTGMQSTGTAGEGGDCSSPWGLQLPEEEGAFPSPAPVSPPTRD